MHKRRLLLAMVSLVCAPALTAGQDVGVPVSALLSYSALGILSAQDSGHFPTIMALHMPQ